MQDYTELYRTHTHTDIQTDTQNLWNLEVLTHLKIVATEVNRSCQNDKRKGDG